MDVSAKSRVHYGSLSHHRTNKILEKVRFLSRYWPHSLPGAFISCVDKKRTKEATGGEALTGFSYRHSGGFGTLYPGKNPPSPPDSSPGATL